jgi:hypothetical protein
MGKMRKLGSLGKIGTKNSLGRLLDLGILGLTADYPKDNQTSGDYA